MHADHVLGRDELIAHYWRRLEVQSLALLAPRRIGKTSITKRMLAYPPPRFIVHARDLEDLESVVHFTRVLFEDVEFDEANARLVTSALLRGAALEVRGAVIDAIIELSEGHPMIIQLLVEGLAKHEQIDEATVHAEFRRVVEPPGDPLAARGVIRRVASRWDFRRGVGAETKLYRAYYEFRRHRPRRKDQARRRDGLHHGLLDLRYYAERIDQNFGPEHAELVRTILDALAVAPGQTLSELLERLPANTSRTELSALLHHLIDDFYLVREAGKHDFRLRFLREFWIEGRGL
jgi:hypothetical protein